MGDWGDHSRRGRALLGICVGFVVHIIEDSATPEKNIYVFTYIFVITPRTTVKRQ